MNLKDIKLYSLFIVTILGFNACGGGGGSSAYFGDAENKIPINVTCLTNPNSNDISNYITLKSGDTIIKETSNAEVSIYHDINGTKKICLVSPSAYILRE